MATPCSASWEAMEGDERIRFCGACKLNVYNLSEMSRTEAEELVRNREGRLCVRFYRRADGTLITRDCPVGMRALRRRLAFSATCICAAFLAVGAYASRSGLPAPDDESTFWDRMKSRTHGVEPFKSFLGWLSPPDTIDASGLAAQKLNAQPMMGEVLTLSADWGKTEVHKGTSSEPGHNKSSRKSN